MRFAAGTANWHFLLPPAAACPLARQFQVAHVLLKTLGGGVTETCREGGAENWHWHDVDGDVFLLADILDDRTIQRNDRGAVYPAPFLRGRDHSRPIVKKGVFGGFVDNAVAMRLCDVVKIINAVGQAAP